MPKAPPASSGPLSCLFAINKPTGQVSMQLLNSLQPLFAASSLFAKQPEAVEQGGKGSRKRKWKAERVKMGQGGTLDPLADGVLVIGTNDATKTLSKFLDCTKEYRAIGYLGCATDSYDSEGKRVRETAWEGITREKIESVLDKFRGEIEQVPPIFSALKMDGKPLYEYARSGTPLPRPIPARKVTVSQLSLLNFTEASGHSYVYPTAVLSEKEIAAMEALESMLKSGGLSVPDTVVEKVKVRGPKGVYIEPEVLIAPVEQTNRAPTFEISMTVSSGTYVRSIVHDIGIALGSSAYVVKLTRTRQGEFTLDDPIGSTSTSDLPAIASTSESTESTAILPEVEQIISGGCIEWSTLEGALKEQQDIKDGKIPMVTREVGEYANWEKELLAKCKII